MIHMQQSKANAYVQEKVAVFMQFVIGGIALYVAYKLGEQFFDGSDSLANWRDQDLKTINASEEVCFATCSLLTNRLCAYWVARSYSYHKLVELKRTQ